MDMSFEDHVRERAYHIWLSGGMADGQAHEHWVMAEQAMKAAEPVVILTKTAKKPAAKAKAAVKPAAAKTAAKIAAKTAAKTAAKSSAKSTAKKAAKAEMTAAH